MIRLPLPGREPGLYLSGAAHAAVLAVALIGLSSPKPFEDQIESVPVEIISESELRQITQGERTAKAVQEKPLPKADRVAEQAVRKPEAPRADREVEAPATPAARPPDPNPEIAEAPTPPARPEPPKPEPAQAAAPTPPAPTPPARPEPPREAAPTPPTRTAARPPEARPEPKPPEPPAPREAEAIRPEPPKRPPETKPEPPKPEAPKPPVKVAEPKPQPTPPQPPQPQPREQRDALAKLAEGAQQPAPQPPRPPVPMQARPAAASTDKGFDASEIQKLLASRDRASTTGSAAPQINRTAALGAATGASAKLNPSQAEALVGLFQEQMRRCMSLPPGALASAKPTIRVQLGRDGVLTAQPALVTGDRAMGEAAMRAIRACAPYKIPERFALFYEDWRSLLITVDASEFL